MGDNTIADEQLLPDFYHVLSVDYNATSDTIKKAFMALTNDMDTFYLYKDMICDAFMCLASPSDRAAYDAFYYKTTCWYSKKLWLQYRDERRRLDWDDVAQKNTDYLADIQQAVMDAFEASLAGDPVGGHAAEKKAAMALSRKTHRCRRPRHHKKEKDENPNEKQLERLKQEKEENAWENWKKNNEEKEKEKKEEKEREQQKTDGNSDSGHSAFTLIEAAEAAEARPSEANPAKANTNGAGQFFIDPAASVSSVYARRGLAVADGIFDKPAYEMPVYDSDEEILPPNTSPHSYLQVSVPSKRMKADSATKHATDPAASKPEQPEVIATNPASDSTEPVASAAKPAHVPAHMKTQAATATRLTGKIATPTAARTFRAARSTATAMTASAASKEKPVQRPAPETRKQPSPTKPPRGPTAPTASSTAKVNSSQRLTRAPLPERRAPPVIKKAQAATGIPTATRPRAITTPITRTTAAASHKSSDAPATPIKRGMASSRWAQPQTCANGQPGHPRTLGNWKRLPLTGKCTACGFASHGKSALASSRHLYWCGMCDASFCNECYIANVLRRQ